MKGKEITILGAGISGLALGYYLRQKHPNATITLIDKSETVGGVIDTTIVDGFLFERGARTFKVKRCHELLRLISACGLQSDLIGYDPPFRRHYIWREGKLNNVTMNPFAFFTNPITRGLWTAFFREHNQPPSSGDETVWDFGSRRFGPRFTDGILDPMLRGIFGGDIRKLSIRATMGTLKRYEEDYGSVTNGIRHNLFRSKPPCPVEGLAKADLFTLRGGMRSLGEAIVKTAGLNFRGGEEVLTLPDYETLYMALPLDGVKRLLNDEVANEFFDSVDMVDLISVNLGYRKRVLKKGGYGYLLSSLEPGYVMGAIFDSEIFPQQNTHPEETRLTVMMGGAQHPEQINHSDEEILKIAKESIEHHLGIKGEPDATFISRYPRAIPQYYVNHLDRLKNFELYMKQKWPHIHLVGNYMRGPSVNECVLNAQRVANS